ncbi:hypothetical protein [Chryseobacterium sp. 8AT]|uniref:hypothetical protein n=1 Tax=Chryseobacterium sp. 8AT TaxID=2653134 RepID=UPI0012F345A6|nr:hypothetical protein [Chryseobacterium sp. 8AT]VXB02700.1 conserved membrane hypothetical protein [Chryseobacterium sp. 8AT]
MFIVTTLMFIIGNAALAFILYMSIQKDQIFDLLFKWQNMLRKFDVAGTTNKLILYKILGGCLLCFSHFLSFIGFWLYLLFILELNAGLPAFWMWIIIYFVYVPTSTTLSLYIHKLLK